MNFRLRTGKIAFVGTIYVGIIFLLFIKYNPENLHDRVIRNSSDPLYGELKLEMIEEILIRESDTDEAYIYKYLYDMAVDSHFNIYVLDPHLKQIIKYDQTGRYIKKIGRIGQGPGEYISPWGLFIDGKDNLYVNDNNRALIQYSSDGLFKKRVKFNSPLADNNFIVDEKGNIYGFFRKIVETEIKKVLLKLDQSGDVIKKIEEYKEKNLDIRRAGSGMIIGGLKHQYSADVFFCHVPQDQLCVGENLNYKFFMYDIEGNLRFTFTKDEKPQSISSDIATLKKRIGKDRMKIYKFPPYKPFFKSLLSDERGRIYVVRVKSIFDKSKSESVDIFNSHGHYLYKATFPYFPQYIRNGFVFAIDRDEQGKAIIWKLTIKNYDQIRY